MKKKGSKVLASRDVAVVALVKWPGGSRCDSQPGDLSLMVSSNGHLGLGAKRLGDQARD